MASEEEVWGTFVPQYYQPIVEEIANALLELLQLLRELPEDRKTSNPQAVFYYEAVSNSINPCGLRNLCKVKREDIDWDEVNLKDDPDDVVRKVRQLAKAIIEQSRVVHPGHRNLSGVGFEVSIDGVKTLLLRYCRWRPGIELKWKAK